MENKKIIAFSGKKGVGKTSAAHFVMGRILMNKGIFPDTESFALNKNNEIILNLSGGHKLLFDPKRRESQFQYECMQNIWPHTRVYSFAEDLKSISVDVFGLNPEHVYGVDEDKNNKTHIEWNSFKPFLPPHEVKKMNESGKSGTNMTVREFLQEFGTRVCRKLYPDIWVDSTFKKMDFYNSEVCIIDDLRFNNEAKKVKDNNGLIIDLNDYSVDDKHSSENGIDSHYIDLSLSRQELSIDERNFAIDKFLQSNGFFKDNE